MTEIPASASREAAAILEELKAQIVAHENWEYPAPVGDSLARLIKTGVPNLIAEVERLQAEAAAAAIINDLAIDTEKRHGDKWQELAGAYDDIRYALRIAPDTPQGHAEFYHEAARLIFGNDQ